MADGFFDLDSSKLDILKEISNIGAGNAATALSQLIDRPVKMSIPRVQLLPFDRVSDVIGGPEEIVAGIFLEVSGDLRADLLLLLPWCQSADLLEIMLGKPASSVDTLDELETSLLEEVGNILANTFLTALNQFTNLKIYPSVPALAVDMAGAVLSLPLARLGEVGDEALVIDTEFLEAQQRAKGFFLFIPGPEYLDKVFQALGVAPR